MMSDRVAPETNGGDIELGNRDLFGDVTAKGQEDSEFQQNEANKSDVDFTYAEKRIIAKLMPTVDSIIGEAVDSIWQKYDKDNSGQLDREETMRFFQKTLNELGETEEFDEKYFEEAFEAFDKDGSGTISQLEMHIFIKQMVDL